MEGLEPSWPDPAVSWVPLGASWGALGGLLEPLEALWGGSWSLLGSSWGLLGRSWRPLGASGGALGGVLEPLGRLLGRLGADPKQHKNIMQKKTNFKSSKGPSTTKFWAPKDDPKSIKIGPKTSQNLRRFSRAKKLLFKSLLEPSWVDLGAFWRPSWGGAKPWDIGKRNVS